jgi:hypothetical protein
MSDFERLRMAMKAARAQATGRTLEQVDQYIHRERLTILQDEPPELGETLADYVARIDRRFGTTFHDAAIEHYRGTTGYEARAAATAREAITKAMRK